MMGVQPEAPSLQGRWRGDRADEGNDLMTYIKDCHMMGGSLSHKIQDTQLHLNFSVSISVCIVQILLGIHMY